MMNPAAVTTVKNTTSLDMLLTPNPVTNNVVLTYTATQNEKTIVQIFNATGISVLTKKLGTQQSGTFNIDFSDFASGVYMVQLTSGNDKVVKRLIKE
jgi:trimeric autotransporter adhesin